jgi:hypothetical protein
VYIPEFQRLYLKFDANYYFVSLVLCTKRKAAIRLIPSGFWILLFPILSAPVTRFLEYYFAVQTAAWRVSYETGERSDVASLVVIDLKSLASGVATAALKIYYPFQSYFYSLFNNRVTIATYIYIYSVDYLDDGERMNFKRCGVESLSGLDVFLPGVRMKTTGNPPSHPSRNSRRVDRYLNRASSEYRVSLLAFFVQRWRYVFCGTAPR